MTRRSRIRVWGSAAVLVLAGSICAVVAGSTAVGAAAVALITLGLGWAFLLVFFEIGLSEDRARAREEEERQRARGERRTPAGSSGDAPRRPRPRWSRRPG